MEGWGETKARKNKRRHTKRPIPADKNWATRRGGYCSPQHRKGLKKALKKGGMTAGLLTRAAKKGKILNKNAYKESMGERRALSETKTQTERKQGK